VAASDIDATADIITAILTLNVKPSASDENIIYYVSDAIARSTVTSTKCDHCRESLISSYVDEELDLPSADFLNSINRGGLVKPTDFVYNLVQHCWRMFEEVRTKMTSNPPSSCSLPVSASCSVRLWTVPSTEKNRGHTPP